MALYLVGDIQGCLTELQQLLKQVDFNPLYDQLWLTGDLIARGPDSLDTLRFIKNLGSSVNFVLGNHDLHLLAIHAGIKQAKPQDKLAALITAPDFNELMNWMSQYPLLLELPDGNAYMSHAGIPPQWSLEQAKKYAALASQKIAGKEREYWLKAMYGNTPNDWDNAHSEIERFRFTVNAFTRMRFCYPDGSLDFESKMGPQDNVNGLKPWYTLSSIFTNTHWIIGHWAALMGITSQDKLYALDTGCVWGNHMTILRWDDKRLFIQQSLLQ